MKVLFTKYSRLGNRQYSRASKIKELLTYLGPKGQEVKVLIGIEKEKIPWVVESHLQATGQRKYSGNKYLAYFPAFL
jgi:hypothetical protein